MTRALGAAYKLPKSELTRTGVCAYRIAFARRVLTLDRASGENDMKKILAAISGLTALASTSSFAAMTPGGIAMQPPASALAEEVHFFHNIILMPIITVISLFVLALLIWVIFRYNAKANPEPKKFSHNTLVEIVWTGVPILILLFIAVFSFDLLYKEDVMPDGKQTVAVGDGQMVDFVFANEFTPGREVVRAEQLKVTVASAGALKILEHRKDYTLDGLGDPEVVVSLKEAPSAGDRVIMRGGRSLVGRGERKQIAMAPTVTLKVNGYQWGWTYAYPDFGDFEFSSNMLPDDQVEDPMKRKLEVDNRVVVPVGETIRVVTTARDVIHAWALPQFAIKIDAVPGRLNETWFNADREGVYYGQCSEICGIKHSFMPIAVEVVSRAEFERWVEEQRAFAGLEPMFDQPAVKVAQAQSASAEQN